jgi:hypothetical protein
LEAEIRQKNRKVKELETVLQWRVHEHQRLSHELLLFDEKIPELSVSSCDSITIAGSPCSIVDAALRCYEEARGKPESDAAVDAFFLELPSHLSALETENVNLMQISAKYKRQYARLKSSQPRQPPSLPPEKVKAAIEKLARSHKRKKEKVTALKDIVRRQHEALQRILGAPASNAVLSLRSLIHQMAICDPGNHASLAAQALEALDSLL